MLYNIFDLDDVIYSSENNMSFIYNEKKYVLRKNAMINDKLFSYNYPSFFHKIISNKYNSIYTIYNNNLYILYQVHDFRSNTVSLHNVINMSIPTFTYNVDKVNYSQLWLRKNHYLESYFDSKYRFSYLNYDYYLGMAEMSLIFSKNVNFDNLTYGYCVKKNNCFACFETLYDPSNVKNGPIVYNISEFIKYDFFVNNNSYVDFNSIFNLKLNTDDYMFLGCRLLYPNFYFDLFINNDNDLKLKTLSVDSKVDSYIILLKSIFNGIKKRHIIDMSLMDYIINLL